MLPFNNANGADDSLLIILIIHNRLKKKDNNVTLFPFAHLKFTRSGYFEV